MNGYHHGKVDEWLEFFLDGVIETGEESIKISKSIRAIRDEDMEKVQQLSMRESESGVLVLTKLFSNPIVNSRTIIEWTGFTRAGAIRLLERLVSLDILKAREEKGAYDRTYIYERYVRCFV